MSFYANRNARATRRLIKRLRRIEKILTSMVPAIDQATLAVAEYQKALGQIGLASEIDLTYEELLTKWKQGEESG